MMQPLDMRWRRRLGAALSALFLVALPLTSQENPTLAEYEVKAAYLLNFARFVDWPPLADRTQDELLSICVLGDDPFEGTLERLARGEVVNGQPIVVRRVSRYEESCRILFVSRSERDLFRVLRGVNGNVLTVGEDERFLFEGGMISFAIENRRVRFDVNLKAAEQASVRISSRLLVVARKVVR
jgi:hypothetical protein